MDQGGHRIDLPGLGLSLHGISLAGICTSLQVPEARLCVDCGVLSPLGARMRYLALTHGHVDHCGALASWLGARSLLDLGASTLYAHPSLHEPLLDVIAAWARIHGHDFPVEVVPVSPGDRLTVGAGLQLEPFATTHRTSSLGYVLLRHRAVLKEAYRGAPGPEIARLRRQGVEVTEERSDPLMAFGGDTLPEALVAHPLARRARVVVSELTFVGGQPRSGVEIARRYRHTHLDDLIDLLDELECERLVLMHLSGKHTVAEVKAALQERLPAAWQDRVILLHHEDRRS